jgi:hypothetical protein
MLLLFLAVALRGSATVGDDGSIAESRRRLEVAVRDGDVISAFDCRRS